MLFMTIIALLGVIAVMAVVIVYFVRKHRMAIKFEHSSEIDEGTGLGNRYYLSRMYEENVPREERPEYVMICIYIDSERMERIYGRDEMLKYVLYAYSTAKNHVSKNAILARIPGVGLMVLEKSDSESLKKILPEIVRRITHFSEDRRNISVCRAAAGVYRLKESDDDIHEVVFNAWQSAERAYNAGEDIAFCSEEMLAAFMEERRMRIEITRAFERHEFVTYIQFYVDTDSAKIVGGEALIRWHHPELGLISPARFIPFMEREDIIPKMDYYNLEEVCKFLDEMNSRGINDFYISCNFSRKTFSAHDFVDNCRKIFANYNFPMSMLAFEMTESVSIKNVDQANRNALDIKSLGIKLLLDDFGEGFASFADLTEYPVDGLKLDKALVDNITTAKGNTILRGMTKMGHELNMTVIVEGVENDEQVKELKTMQCDVIQGFRFHRPIPVWEAKETLLQHAPAKT